MWRTCAFACMCAYGCVIVYVSVRVCVCMSVRICACACVRVRMCACIRVCMCMVCTRYGHGYHGVWVGGCGCALGIGKGSKDVSSGLCKDRGLYRVRLCVKSVRLRVSVCVCERERDRERERGRTIRHTITCYAHTRTKYVRTYAHNCCELRTCMCMVAIVGCGEHIGKR